jgi:cytochrome c-type biogenesis protein CcmH/NrfF
MEIAIVLLKWGHAADDILLWLIPLGFLILLIGITWINRHISKWYHRYRTGSDTEAADANLTEEANDALQEFAVE